MIVVFGSLGVDLVTNVSHIPHPGETVLCEGYFMVPGGKGANQAVAAARAGSKTAIIGSRGNDGFADLAVSVMVEAGVDISGLRSVERPTAVALITVEESGENAIVVASGANQLTEATQLEAYPLAKGDIVLLQREIRDSENFAAIAQAKARGARVILNVAPAGPIPADMLRLLLPKSLGGQEIHILEYARTIEALGYADASVGWFINQSNVSSATSAAALLSCVTWEWILSACHSTRIESTSEK